jgi:NAD(P)-dependent dehydrogenase (short-subunit alcohol dehydrogenase family)
VSAETLSRTFQVNTIGPALVTNAYLSFLTMPGKRGVVVNVSSVKGSLEATSWKGMPAYSMSKAALNMLVR